jgi:hypothetical protein
VIGLSNQIIHETKGLYRSPSPFSRRGEFFGLEFSSPTLPCDRSYAMPLMVNLDGGPDASALTAETLDEAIALALVARAWKINLSLIPITRLPDRA